MWQVLRTSCRVLFRVLLRSTDGILKFIFSTGILSCRRDRLRRTSGIFQFSQTSVYVFLLAVFVYISYPSHFTITSLVIFAELCIFLCNEVFSCIKIYIKSFNLRPIFVRHFVSSSSIFCQSCQSFLTSPFCSQFYFFALVKLNWFGINWHVVSQTECRNCCLHVIN